MYFLFFFSFLHLNFPHSSLYLIVYLKLYSIKKKYQVVEMVVDLNNNEIPTCSKTLNQVKMVNGYSNHITEVSSSTQELRII